MSASIWSGGAAAYAGYVLTSDLASVAGAGLGGFASSTNYAVGTIGHRLNASISLGSFAGADPTGVLDNTANFAIALLLGTDVFVPAGTWSISALTVAAQGQMIHGLGALSIIKATNPAVHLFTVTGDYVTFRDLRLNGAATDATNITFAIFTDISNTASSILVERVLFSGASAVVGFNNAIKFDDGCSRGAVKDCEFERLWGSASGRGYGVLVGASSSVTVTTSKFYGSTGRGRHAVYFSAGASYCKSIGNHAEYLDAEAFTQYSVGAQPPCVGNEFLSNTMVNCCNAGGASNASLQINGHSTSVKIIGNVVINSGAKGIAVDGTGVSDLKDTLVLHNIVRDSQLIGLDLLAAVGGSAIGNHIHESSRAAANVSTNIRLRSDGTTGTTGWVITDNRSTGAGFARSSLSLDSTSPAPSNNVIYGNKFDPGVTGRIEYNGVFCVVDGVAVSGDRGDSAQTLVVGTDAPTQRWATALTANRIITLSAVGAINGSKFRVVRTGLGAFTLDVGGLKTIAISTAAFVDVEYDGTIWRLTAYGPL